MIALLRKQSPSQSLYRYHSANDGAYLAADWLRLLYAHDLYRDRITALEGTVLKGSGKSPKFDMHDPDAREWARGYSPELGVVFDPKECDGYRFVD